MDTVLAMGLFLISLAINIFQMVAYGKLLSQYSEVKDTLDKIQKMLSKSRK